MVIVVYFLSSSNCFSKLWGYITFIYNSSVNFQIARSIRFSEMQREIVVFFFFYFVCLHCHKTKLLMMKNFSTSPKVNKNDV